SHFFGAIKISAFTDPQEFRRNMDDLLGKIRNSPRAEGCERIYVPGEKEFESEERNNRNGIPVDRKSYENLKKIAEKYQIGMEF
ncbi:MAG: Ldh family oxidoreductase, partial [Lentisphaeria bacterium]|nr:Ldh family oxidoreductase [Lentisphaeria bacterium]